MWIGGQMKVLKRSLLVFGVCLIAISNGLAQDTCKRNLEAGFSLCVPEGWTAEAKPEQKFKMLFAPPGEGFNANINLKEDSSSLSLTAYVGESIKAIMSNPPTIAATNIKLLGWTDFNTSSGLSGNRIVLETEYKGLLIRTIQYYLSDGENHKIIVTGTCLVKDKDRHEGVFDRAAKSLRVDRSQRVDH